MLSFQILADRMLISYHGAAFACLAAAVVLMIALTAYLVHRALKRRDHADR